VGSAARSRSRTPRPRWRWAPTKPATSEAAVRDVVADMEVQGEQVPVPLSERQYSGKFNVRVGEHLHRDLALHAAEDGMSLNQYVVKKLAAG